MLYAVRVRGIYSTALSVLLHEKGFLLTDASKVLESRLPLPTIRRAPEATVKSLSDDLDYILVIGYPWESGEAIYNTIVENIQFTVKRRGQLGLYTVLDAESLGDCRLQLNGFGELSLQGEECPPKGEIIRATVVREALEPGRTPVVKKEIRLIGMHTIITVPGTGVSFSEHIRSEEDRARLFSIALRISARDSVHIHFRSGAKLADNTVIENEISSLIREAEQLWNESPNKPGIVRRGEFIGLIGFTLPAKKELDAYRSKIIETIDYHHSLKSLGEESSMLVDCAEECMKLGSKIDGTGIMYYIAKKNKNRKIIIYHKKPDGTLIQLGPYQVKNIRLANNSIVIEMEKTIKSRGILDGLGVEKRPGDIVKTLVETGKWHIIHEYYDKKGKILGVYANINTPPEIGIGYIKYFDLYIDVVKLPGKKPDIIDTVELQNSFSRGYISEKLVEKALEEAENLQRKLSSIYE